MINNAKKVETAGVILGIGNVSGHNYYYFRFSKLNNYEKYTFSCTAPNKNFRKFKFIQLNQNKTYNWIFPRNKDITRLLAFGDWSDSQNATSTDEYTTKASSNNFGWSTINYLQENRANYYDGFLYAGDMAYNLHNMEYFDHGQKYLKDNGVSGNTWMKNIGNFLNNQPFFVLFL